MQHASRSQSPATDDAEDAVDDGAHTYDLWSSPISGFIDRWKACGEAYDQLTAAFFALSGFSPDRQERLAVEIPEDNVVPEDVEKQFDIDSVRGAIFEGELWPFTGQMQVYPIPPPTESVSEGSRYYISVDGRNVSEPHGSCQMFY